MKPHRPDLVALLFGLAFTIAGALVIATQATGVDVNPHWGAAAGLILLGIVALVVTVARARDERPKPIVSEPMVSPPLVSSEDPAG